MQTLDGNTVQQLIPNRFPIFYVDDVTALTPDVSVTVHKYLTHAEDHLTGYAPGQGLLANSLMIEMMAQAASVLILNSPLFAHQTAYLAAINDAKFPLPVKAGSCLEITVTMGKVRANMGTVACVASVAGQLVGEATLRFVVQAGDGA